MSMLKHLVPFETLSISFFYTQQSLLFDIQEQNVHLTSLKKNTCVDNVLSENLI